MNDSQFNCMMIAVTYIIVIGWLTFTVSPWIILMIALTGVNCNSGNSDKE